MAGQRGRGHGELYTHVCDSRAGFGPVRLFLRLEMGSPGAMRQSNTPSLAALGQSRETAQVHLQGSTVGLFLFETELSAGGCGVSGGSTCPGVSSRAELETDGVCPVHKVPSTTSVVPEALEATVSIAEGILMDCSCLSSLKRAANFSANEGIAGEIPCVSWGSGFT